jgi:hypothetical protein
MFVALFGRNKLVKILLKHGNDPAIWRRRGLTAPELAIQQGNEAAIEMLH